MLNTASRVSARRPLAAALVAVLVVALPSLAAARQWKEEDFWPRSYKSYTFTPPSSVGDTREQTVIGETSIYRPEKGDTFFDLARYFDLGYNELVDANPGVDEWIPGHFDKPVVVPQEFILPYGTYDGIVINIPEMRLYYYRSAGKGAPKTVITFPVGLGREEWKTPIGKFTVREKTVNPTWVIPESIRKERIKDRGYSETMIPGGHPSNPLGKYRMRLSLDLYGIHGTNIPWGVGMLVSHGCVRLYPEDIEKLYPLVPMGTPGVFVYQPIKVGMRDGRVYVEVHKDLYGMKPGMYRETVRMLEKRGLIDLVDEEKLREAVLAQSGVPVDVSLGSPRHEPVPVEVPEAVEVSEPGEPLERRDAPPAAEPQLTDDLPTEDLRDTTSTTNAASTTSARPALGAARAPAQAPARVSEPRPTLRGRATREGILLPTEVIVPRGTRPIVAED